VITLSNCILCSGKGTSITSEKPRICSTCFKRCKEKTIKKYLKLARKSGQSDHILKQSQIDKIVLNSVCLRPEDVKYAKKHKYEFCTRCASCCKNYENISIPKSDAGKLIEIWGTQTFNERVKAKENGDGWTLKNTQPCSFLNEDKNCTIYDERPFSCRRFPLSTIKNQVFLLGHSYCSYTYNLISDIAAATLAKHDKTTETTEKIKRLSREIENKKINTKAVIINNDD